MSGLTKSRAWMHAITHDNSDPVCLPVYICVPSEILLYTDWFLAIKYKSVYNFLLKIDLVIMHSDSYQLNHTNNIWKISGTMVGVQQSTVYSLFSNLRHITLTRGLFLSYLSIHKPSTDWNPSKIFLIQAHYNENGKRKLKTTIPHYASMYSWPTHIICSRMRCS